MFDVLEWWRYFLVIGHPQKKPTEIWEDNASCIMMSENPTNRDRSRHVDVKVLRVIESFVSFILK
jgi:hypothetical protein